MIDNSSTLLNSIEESLRNRLIAQIEGNNFYRGEEGIVRFVYDVIGAKKVHGYQEEILREFVRNHRAAIRAPHGAGKSCLSSWAVLWLMGVYPPEVDVKVVTTASAWRQLEKFLWPEIRKWGSQTDWSMLGLKVRLNRELLGLNFRLNNKEAFAAASDNPAMIEGAHATVIGYVFDEAKAIPEGTWDAAEGAFSQEGLEGHEAYALAISTPGDEEGRFYQIHQRKKGLDDWWVRHITLEEAIVAGQISQTWADQRKRQWGEDSDVYKRRVLGEFSSSSSSSVIPLSWIELANERWLAWQDEHEISKEPEFIGVDPARFGDDFTAIARFRDFTCLSIDYVSQMDTVEIAKRVMDMDPLQTKPTAVDSIGIGAGVVDRMREGGYIVLAVNTSEPTYWTDVSGEIKFLNLRAYLWWLMREYLDPNMPRDQLIALPPDEKLIADLASPKWTETSRGLIQIESKKQLRKRLGRSPDSADSVLLALYASFVGNSHGIFV